MNYCAQNRLADEFWDQINEISFELRMETIFLLMIFAVWLHYLKFSGLSFFVLKVMNLVAHGTEMSDVVMAALDFCHCGPGSMPGFDAILGWGLLCLFPVPKGVFQVLWVSLTIKVLDLISTDLR